MLPKKIRKFPIINRMATKAAVDLFPWQIACMIDSHLEIAYGVNPKFKNIQLEPYKPAFAVKEYIVAFSMDEITEKFIKLYQLGYLQVAELMFNNTFNEKMDEETKTQLKAHLTNTAKHGLIDIYMPTEQNLDVLAEKLTHYVSYCASDVSLEIKDDLLVCSFERYVTIDEDGDFNATC